MQESMKSQLPKVALALLPVLLLLGCQDQGSEPMGLDDLGPQFGVNCDNKPDHPKCGGGGEDPAAGTFDVTVRTVGGSEWTTAGAQEVQDGDATGWLHVYDSGGKGTRGNPDYDNAAFDTEIHFKPATQAGCVGDLTLFDELDQTSAQLRVFDFQATYDIAEIPEDHSFFLFRWQDGDGTFSASTARGPTIDFLGDNDGGTDRIDDPTITRVFRISGAMVRARELNRKKVVRELDCPNPYVFEVTVAPHVTP
jgi:hypothetical protein